MNKSDGEMERMVEDWLEAEARPMPQQVLESSLEAVARTRQTGYRSPADGRRRTMRFAMVAATVALSVVVISAVPTILRSLNGLPPPGAGPSSGASATPTSPLPTSPVPASQGMTWDLVLTFRELNPAPDGYGHSTVFSYMRGSTGEVGPSTYIPLPEFTPGEVSRWHDPAFPGLYVACCDTTPGLQLHPSGGGSDALTAIVAWRNPVGPTPLEIRGSVEVDGSCGDGILFSILNGTEPIERLEIREGRHPLFLNLSSFDPGQVLYFVVEPGADSACDTTWLTALIESR